MIELIGLTLLLSVSEVLVMMIILHVIGGTNRC